VPEQGAKIAVRVYVGCMKIVLVILVALMMLATLGVLLAGLLGLARGGNNPQRSNRLMRWRVVLQAGTLLLFLLLLSLMRS
jgi:hypothetical protein